MSRCWERVSIARSAFLTMKLGIQRLLKENFSEITGVNAITDVDISALLPAPDAA